MSSNVHLPVCFTCSTGIREKLAFLDDIVGCRCDLVIDLHYHDEPGVYVQVGPYRQYCLPCICCGDYCIPDAVLCATVTELWGGVVLIDSYEFAELGEPEQEEIGALS